MLTAAPRGQRGARVQGEFRWSSQHLDPGVLEWGDRWVGKKRRQPYPSPYLHHGWLPGHPAA